MNYRVPFLAAAVIVAAGAAFVAYVLAVDIQTDEQTLTEKS
ncbi:hypothetical protein [Rhodococcus sp. 06-235-1A]|nr:hypothetical protein [Rhodococcus sp. 06-235-1A]